MDKKLLPLVVAAKKLLGQHRTQRRRRKTTLTVCLTRRFGICKNITPEKNACSFQGCFSSLTWHRLRVAIDEVVNIFSHV